MLAGGILLAALPRVAMEAAATFRAQRAVAEAGAEGLQGADKALALAKWSASRWTPTGDPWFFRFTPFLYHRHLPEWVRLPRGSVELFVRHGECNSAAAMLHFLLRTQGIGSTQIDFVNLSGGGHSALQASIGGEAIFLDPFFGVAFRSEGRLLSFGAAQERARDGAPPAYTALKPGADFSFYKRLPDLLHAEAGQPLDIRVSLPARAEIGRVDGSAGDIEADAVKLHMSPYQHFFGARYSRHWRKIYRTGRPVELAFHLTEPVARDALPASNITPEVDGAVVRYKLDCRDCELVLDPKDVPWDWSRLKAWYDVDQLTIRPL